MPSQEGKDIEWKARGRQERKERNDRSDTGYVSHVLTPKPQGKTGKNNRTEGNGRQGIKREWKVRNA
jgi:hypothetical protein